MRGADFTYDLAFEPLADADADDVRYDDRGLTVLIPGDSIPNIRAPPRPPLGQRPGRASCCATPNRPRGPDARRGHGAGGRPRRRSGPCSTSRSAPGPWPPTVGSPRWCGSRARWPTSPSGGGCQGCAVSAITLQDGIKAAILANVPEITEVLDSTDHGAGENTHSTRRSTSGRVARPIEGWNRSRRCSGPSTGASSASPGCWSTTPPSPRRSCRTRFVQLHRRWGRPAGPGGGAVLVAPGRGQRLPGLGCAAGRWPGATSPSPSRRWSAAPTTGSCWPRSTAPSPGRWRRCPSGNGPASCSATTTA